MQNINKPNSNPQLKDLLDAWKDHVFINMNCHAIGTIESFDPENQTVSVSINYLKSYIEGDRTVVKKYPLLLDCPIIMMSGGNATLTFPIEQGDTCLILFNDRSIDEWFASGQVTELGSNRTHALSDGIALIGVRSNSNKLEDYDENRGILRKGSFALGVGDKILLTSNYPTATETMNTRLQELVNEIKALASAAAAITVAGVTTGGGTSGPPTNAASFASISSNLTTIATSIGDLLE